MSEELDIDWEWPMQKLQTQRIQFYMGKLEDEDIVDILTPTEGEKKSERKTSIPYYRCYYR